MSSSSNEILKKVLLNSINYELKELKDKVKIFNNDQLMTMMLELLKEEIDSLNPSSSFNDYKYLYKCFIYMDDCMDRFNPKNNEIYLQQLNIIRRKLSKLIKRCNRSNNKGIYVDNEFILEKLKENVEMIIDNYSNITTTTTIVDGQNVYDFLKHLIFDVKKYNYVEEIFNKFPELINFNNGKNHIFDEIIDQYIDQVNVINGVYNMMYLKKVINYFINNPKFRIKEDWKKEIINRLWQTMDNLKRADCSKKEKNEQKFFLEELINDLKKIEITNYEKAINCINHKYQLNPNFSGSALEEIHNLKAINGVYYNDLRNKRVITIDSDNAKSLDGAFSFEILPNGNHLVGIYFSDVSGYIKTNTSLDLEAYAKGETIYLPGLTLPMFPPKLTYDFFSLDALRDKLVVAHLFEISPNMDLANHRIERAIVTINNNFTYTDINDILNNGNKENAELIKNMILFSEKLKKQNEGKDLYHQLKGMRRAVTNYNNSQYDNSDGARIVEELTIFVGHFVTHLFHQKGLPYIYRNNLSKCDKNMFINLQEQWNNNTKIDDIVSCINKMYEPSFYSTTNLGHAGLNLTAYGQINIPIRNYVALVNQRLEKRFLIDNQIISDSHRQRLEERLAIIAKYINERRELNAGYIEEYGKTLTKKYKSN